MPRQIRPPGMPQEVLVIVEAFGLSAAKTQILHLLATNPKGLRLTQIADDLACGRPTAHRLLSELESEGLVEADLPPEARSRRIVIWTLNRAELDKQLAEFRRFLLGDGDSHSLERD